ncbi:MAG: asparagine synthase (glutamine-hydrolyzing), partial [Thermomicrobiales bacterium]|nr:asparagine synthase (glutamine-hydrolyzing) [Thermomicrobiales bacterium]
MCGITGLWGPPVSTGSELTRAVKAMTQMLEHRGPDDFGIWIDESQGVALGFRRLAIVDLSSNGHQPMSSASGRYEMVFNGEIYNFAELRRELEALGFRFRGGSDTEVILAAIEAWTLDVAVTRFVGMFAIALWDREHRRLHLVRDRLGIKPLYYGWFGQTLMFGSELKALAVHPDFEPEINRDSLALYLRHGYVPDPYSIYQNVKKLPPGTILSVNGPGASDASPRPYWSARAVALAGLENPHRGSRTDAAEELDALLRSAVALRMVADVPLGAFLSGGVDSSTLVALMQAQSNRPVKTFTIGFNEDGYDEAAHAAAVARHLGTEHTSLIVTPAEARDVIPMLPWMYDEPFADSSQIPTYLVSRLAREQVTVSLSGDGGDELFGGYNRYFWGEAIWSRIGRVPRSARGLGGRALTSVSAESWNRQLSRLNPVLPRRLRQQTPGDKLHKLAEVLSVESGEALYHGLVSQWRNPSVVVAGGREPATVLTDKAQWAELPEFSRRMMYLDLVSYLPGDILTKVDRASMAVGLEARVPLLDHRVVEFAARIPVEMNISGGQGKGLLRDVLYQYVPQALMDRPKMGFGVPI